MIQALLAAQTSERGRSGPSSVVDHSAQRESLFVKKTWDQIAMNITEQTSEMSQEETNSQDFEEMLNLYQNVEDAGVASDTLFRYFHL